MVRHAPGKLVPALLMALAFFAFPLQTVVKAQDGSTPTALFLPAVVGGGAQASPTGSGDLSIAAGDAARNELNGGATPFAFTITRAGQLNQVTTVKCVVSGSGTNAATSDDFEGSQLLEGLLQFDAGETSKPLIVRVQGDKAVEPNEGFVVTLVSVSGSAHIVTPSASTTIRNDDVTLSTDLALAASDTEQLEGADSATSFVFNVTRAGIVDGVTTVYYSVAGSGATPAAADDFVDGVFPAAY